MGALLRRAPSRRSAAATLPSASAPVKRCSIAAASARAARRAGQRGERARAATGPAAAGPRCSRASSVAGTPARGRRAAASSASPSGGGSGRLLTSTKPSAARPANTSTWCSSVGSWITRRRAGDRLVGADRRVVDPAERLDRVRPPLRPEARERLRVAAVDEGGHREQLGGGDDALAAASVEADLEHGSARISVAVGKTMTRASRRSATPASVLGRGRGAAFPQSRMAPGSARRATGTSTRSASSTRRFA